MSRWPESRGRSLDVALQDGWIYGGGLVLYWISPHLPWWERLVQVLILVAFTFALRRLRSWRSGRVAYWTEYQHGQTIVHVEARSRDGVERLLGRLGQQATGAMRRTVHGHDD